MGEDNTHYLVIELFDVEIPGIGNECLEEVIRNAITQYLFRPETYFNVLTTLSPTNPNKRRVVVYAASGTHSGSKSIIVDVEKYKSNTSNTNCGKISILFLNYKYDDLEGLCSLVTSMYTPGVSIRIMSTNKEIEEKVSERINEKLAKKDID